MLVAGPSSRNPKANYRIELMRLDAEGCCNSTMKITLIGAAGGEVLLVGK